ncbi:MAG: hypothetical protein SGI87_03625 [Flavobacteriales bacterium]|nr:hypothetical protein [Flavobacteriales bacterium]
MISELSIGFLEPLENLLADFIEVSEVYTLSNRVDPSPSRPADFGDFSFSSNTNRSIYSTKIALMRNAGKTVLALHSESRCGFWI